MARAPPPPASADADADADDARVDTCDDARALDRAAARALADRLYYGGFFALPWLWVINAWFFAPHATKNGGARCDPHIAARARASRAMATIAIGACAAWAGAFYVGGRRLVGDAFFERFSATTRDA